MKKIRKVLLTIVCLSLVSCVTPKRGGNAGGETGGGETPELEYNFKFVGVDVDISNPANDKRAYYKLFIDKVYSGYRTNIALESQDKIFKGKLTPNKHLLRVEKYRLDESVNRYVKLNNIKQPKPDFIYFDIPVGKVVVIKLLQDTEDNSAEFKIDYE